MTQQERFVAEFAEDLQNIEEADTHRLIEMTTKLLGIPGIIVGEALYARGCIRGRIQGFLIGAAFAFAAVWWMQ